MLALVKKPHIEVLLHGEHVAELVDWIKKRFEVEVLSEEPEDEFVSIESTDYWKEMEKNRMCPCRQARTEKRMIRVWSWPLRRS